jgi:hypothetical protein
MTLRDFEIIAKGIRESSLSDRDKALMAEGFVELLRETNDLFDSFKFREACLPKRKG